MKAINSNQLGMVVTQNQYIPDEGPSVVPILLDFSNTGVLNLEPLLDQQRTRFPSMIQAIYVDTHNITGDLTITVLQTGQIIIVPPNRQGYYTLLSPNPPRMKFENEKNDFIRVHLFNGPIPGATWSTK